MGPHPHDRQSTHRRLRPSTNPLCDRLDLPRSRPYCRNRSSDPRSNPSHHLGQATSHRHAPRPLKTLRPRQTPSAFSFATVRVRHTEQGPHRAAHLKGELNEHQTEACRLRYWNRRSRHWIPRTDCGVCVTRLVAGCRAAAAATSPAQVATTVAPVSPSAAVTPAPVDPAAPGVVDSAGAESAGTEPTATAAEIAAKAAEPAEAGEVADSSELNVGND